MGNGSDSKHAGFQMQDLASGAKQLGAGGDHGDLGEQEAVPKRGSIKGAKLTRTYLVDLIKRQQYRCSLSGIELTPETAALDHVVAVSNGGEHTPENVTWVHNEINRMKGTLSVEEFVALCSKVVQWKR